MGFDQCTLLCVYLYITVSIITAFKDTLGLTFSRTTSTVTDLHSLFQTPCKWNLAIFSLLKLTSPLGIRH
jgi:hypothetical protein